jgi:hypothetical protein
MSWRVFEELAPAVGFAIHLREFKHGLLVCRGCTQEGCAYFGRYPPHPLLGQTRLSTRRFNLSSKALEALRIAAGPSYCHTIAVASGLKNAARGPVVTQSTRSIALLQCHITQKN